MFRICVVIGLHVIAGVALAAEPQHEAHNSPEHDNLGGQIELSEALHEALVAEMVAIDRGMRSLASAIPRGDWPTVRAQSQQIHDSFILRQELSETELQELHRALPADFLALDRRFHQHAQRLAHVAAEGDAELAVFYFSKLVQGCIDCHASFAAESFPGLVPPAATEHSH